MLRRRLGCFGGFEQFFQGVGHRGQYNRIQLRMPRDFVQLSGKLFPHVYSGKLSCFFAGISTFLPRSIASARAIRFRVECGMMTSSI